MTLKAMWAALVLVPIAQPLLGQDDPRLLKALVVFQLEYASDPQISPDGERIVYLRNSMSVMKDRRRSSLWIVDADGSGHRKLGSGEGKESSPRWSPDGGRVAYVAESD